MFLHLPCLSFRLKPFLSIRVLNRVTIGTNGSCIFSRNMATLIMIWNKPLWCECQLRTLLLLMARTMVKKKKVGSCSWINKRFLDAPSSILHKRKDTLCWYKSVLFLILKHSIQSAELPALIMHYQQVDLSVQLKCFFVFLVLCNLLCLFPSCVFPELLYYFVATKRPDVDVVVTQTWDVCSWWEHC